MQKGTNFFKAVAVMTLKGGAALLGSLILWEVLLRLFIASPVPYHQDAQLGWMPQPHSSGLVAYEGRGWCRYNERGFRDSAITPRQPGEMRILCLGDSYTEGGQMAESKTYPRRLQELLNAQAAPQAFPQASRVRVFNGGRAGTTIAFTVALSQEYQALFEPDWTVVLVRDGWNELFSREQEIYYKPVGDGFRIKTEWHWDHMSRPMKLLIRYRVRDIALFQYGKRHLSELLRAAPEEGAPPQAPSTATPETTASPRPKASPDKTLRSIGWTVKELKGRYPRLLLVHIPYTRPDKTGLAPATDRETVLLAECARQNVPLIPMRPLLEADFARTRQPSFGFANTLPWSGHPNAHGHELIAQAVANWMKQHAAAL